MDEIDADAAATGTPDQQGQPDATEPQAADMAAEADKWKALARKHEAQAKANAEAARRLAELEESQKSEQERLSERAARAEAELAEARAEALRLKVAAEAGLPADLLEFLTGPDEDAVRAQAEKLKAAAAPRFAGKADQGAREGGSVAQLTRDDIKRMTPDQIVQAKAEGRLDALLGIAK